MATKARLFSLPGVLSTLISTSIFAQDYRGRMQGVVSDPSQAVVAGAAVTLTNVNTGITVLRTTNESGHYLFDLVEPGGVQETITVAGEAVEAQFNASSIETTVDDQPNADSTKTTFYLELQYVLS